MKGDRIPKRDNIARFCRPRYAPDGKIQATAFMLRMNEESLSVNWLEILNCPNRENEILEIQRIYSKKLSVTVKAKIAILNVGEMCEKVRSESLDRRSLEVLHDPSKGDESHSEIYKLRPDNELIAELILETMLESYPARQS